MHKKMKSWSKTTKKGKMIEELLVDKIQNFHDGLEKEVGRE